jgi:UDP-glucose 4-epimerase
MNRIKYFVSGGAGFIGSHLVDKLIQVGDVIVYDNFLAGHKEFIEQHITNPNFHLIEGDLLDEAKLNKAIANVNVVFHFAANSDARLGITNPRLDLNLETMATFNLLEAMKNNQINEIVFASSGTVYGETPIIPLKENYGPLLPISLYGAGKLACEGLISAFCDTFNMRGWIFRFANIIGKRATHGVIYDFINKLAKNPSELEILGDGSQRKPYLYVDDCISGILWGYKHSKEKINLYNLGCPTTTDVKTIASILIDKMGLKNVQIKYTGGDRGWIGDVPQVCYDVSKINKIGWKAQMTSDEAVAKAIEDMLSL